MGLPIMDWETTEPTDPVRLTVPLNPVAMLPPVSLAVIVSENGALATWGEETVPNVKLATAPAWTAKAFVAALCPPAVTVRATAGSVLVTVTLGLHAPAANVPLVGRNTQIPDLPGGTEGGACGVGGDLLVRNVHRSNSNREGRGGGLRANDRVNGYMVQRGIMDGDGSARAR